MAWLVGDGFDFYANVADAAANPLVWQTATASVLGPTFGITPRFGFGNCLQLGNTSALVGNMITAQFTNSNVLYVNMNIRAASSAHVAGGTTQLVGFDLRDTTNIQCGLWLRNGGDFVLTSGAVGSAVLATSPVLMPLAGVWAHIQAKITIHNTAGAVELRLNGNAVANWTATGLNTRNGTANLFANVVHLTSSSASAADAVDDFYVFNDQAPIPNTFQGDVRAIQQFPTTDTSIQWTRNTGTNNCLAVDDPVTDVDATYVGTNVPGFTDIYALTPLAVTPTVIVAVVPRYQARHDDAGPHTVTAQLTSGGTTVNLPNYNTTATYAYQQAVYPQDPNTAAVWTPTAVNAILLSLIDVL